MSKAVQVVFLAAAIIVGLAMVQHGEDSSQQRQRVDDTCFRDGTSFSAEFDSGLRALRNLVCPDEPEPTMLERVVAFFSGPREKKPITVACAIVLSLGPESDYVGLYAVLFGVTWFACGVFLGFFLFSKRGTAQQKPRRNMAVQTPKQLCAARNHSTQTAKSDVRAKSTQCRPATHTAQVQTPGYLSSAASVAAFEVPVSVQPDAQTPCTTISPEHPARYSSEDCNLEDVQWLLVAAMSSRSSD